MTPIKNGYLFLVWGFAAYLVISKLQPRNSDKVLEQLMLMLMLTTCLPLVAFVNVLIFHSQAPWAKKTFLIGKGTAVVCPIVSTFLMSLLKIDEKIMHHIQFTILGFALVFLYSPNIFLSTFYHLPAPFQTIHKRFIMTHGAMIYFLIQNYRAETAAICFMQAVMWIWSFVGIHEFSSVCWIDLRLREDNLNEDFEAEQDTSVPEADNDFPDDVEQEPETQDYDQNEEDLNLEALNERLGNMEQLMETPSNLSMSSAPASSMDHLAFPSRCQCKICLLDYSTTRIPRMLSKCGHTICEKCAGQLLKDGTRFYTYYIASASIRCPFCREGTVVQGSVQQMPKNYELVEVIGI